MRRGDADADAVRLSGLVGQERAAIRWASALGTLAGATWIGQAWLLAAAIGGLIAAETSVTIDIAVLGFVGLAILRTGIDAFGDHLGFAASERIALRTRERLLAALARTSPLDGRRLPSGEAATILSSHIDALNPYLTRYAPARMRVLVLPAAIILVTAFVSWAAALILVVAGPMIPIFMALIGLNARAASERQLAEIGSLGGYLLDRLQGVTTIRLFAAVERTAATIEARAAAIHDSTMGVLRIAFLSSAVLELFAALGVALVAVYIGFSLLGYFNFGAWDGRLTLAEGLFVLLIAPEYFQPLRDFAAAYHDRAAALAASREVGRVLEYRGPALVGAGGAATRSGRTPPAIAFEGVSLRLGEEQALVLHNVWLSIGPGEHVALVGSSGSGKSMILGLMAGLIAASDGVVRCAGAPLTDATADAWRARLAWLSQRPGFVKGSVLSNLALGRSRPDPARLAHAIGRAAAGDVIAKLPRGLATAIGEWGQGVSGGEAHRLALARAALADADVVLADEPTEHLDDDTAGAVIDGLLAVARSRTLVVATHDARLVRRMQRVVDVDRLATQHRAQALEAAS